MIPTDSSEHADQAAVLESKKTASNEGGTANRTAPPQSPIPSSAPNAAQRNVPAPAIASAPAPRHKPKWLTYGTPVLVVLLAAAVVATITRNWNAWEGGRIEQVTDDAYVWGDLTPLSTKVPGIVRDVKVSDFQR